MSINIEENHTLHSIIGGMTNDYFDFFCKECGSHINNTDFYSLDTVGVKLVTKCDGCGNVSIFKLKCSIPLGPIEFTVNYSLTKKLEKKVNYGFKAYDQRQLKTYQKEIKEKIRKEKRK